MQRLICLLALLVLLAPAALAPAADSPAPTSSPTPSAAPAAAATDIQVQSAAQPEKKPPVQAAPADQAQTAPKSGEGPGTDRAQDTGTGTMPATPPAISPGHGLRVVLLDFIDATSGGGPLPLAAPLDRESFAAKGADLMAQALLQAGGYVIIDRRDLIRQLRSTRYFDGTAPVEDTLFTVRERPSHLRPGVLQAARALGAQTLLLGRIESLSTGRRAVNQGGWQADFTELDMRVRIQALSAADGRVMGVAEGRASRSLRQTPQQRLELSEGELLDLYAEALAQALPGLSQMLGTSSPARGRMVRLSVATTADPAVLEIDGIMVGSTPVLNYSLPAGDHVLALTRAGYQGVTKTIVLTGDTHLTIPMQAISLSAPERAQAMENSGLHILKVE